MGNFRVNYKITRSTKDKLTGVYIDKSIVITDSEGSAIKIAKEKISQLDGYSIKSFAYARLFLVNKKACSTKDCRPYLLWRSG